MWRTWLHLLEGFFAGHRDRRPIETEVYVLGVDGDVAVALFKSAGEALLDHAHLFGTDVGLRIRDAYAVLPHAIARHRIDAQRPRHRSAGVSSRDAHVSSRALGNDAQQRACSCGHRSLVFAALSNHGASMDLYTADCNHSLSLRRELHHISDHAEDSVAHHHLRIDIAKRNAHSCWLTAVYFPFGNIEQIEVNPKYPVCAHTD